MSYKQSKRIILPIILGVLGFIMILISETINQIHGSKMLIIAWLASILVTISTIIIRFYSIDPEKFKDVIQKTSFVENRQLKPLRFSNWIVIAMIVGLIATIVIAFDFIIGMIVYLLMQISLIIAFSGIIFINPFVQLNHPKLRKIFLISIIFWILFIPIVFFVFVWNGTESLIVVPYVITIGAMACISWFGVAYTQRSKIFRYFIVAASSLFVFSDLLIGNARYGTLRIDVYLLIDITYVLNILLMSHAQLFLRGVLRLSSDKKRMN
ncbi:MAG: lysoplasmalogenase family protein [Candidatus Hodarchaeota archaeon]